MNRKATTNNHLTLACEMVKSSPVLLLGMLLRPPCAKCQKAVCKAKIRSEQTN
jgi:hypothetical protein